MDFKQKQKIKKRERKGGSFENSEKSPDLVKQRQS